MSEATKPQTPPQEKKALEELNLHSLPSQVELQKMVNKE